MDVIEKDRLCSNCGGELSTGPFGSRCMRCVMSLLAEPESDGMIEAADLFPELALEEKVARGGFGTVFRAQHRQMKRPVALKFLDTTLARSAEAVALFQKEMVTVGGLDHPGIVRAHDAGERDGRWYIIMEFVDGADCGALARKHGTLPIAESCEIIRQAALALHYAHGKGLVHRDVKPGNIMIAGAVSQLSTLNCLRLSPLRSESQLTVKVLDFGLASIAVVPLLDNPAAVEDDSTGDRFLGTLEYVAPEQIEAPAKVDARADIYALGATLRRFLTGKPAREGRSEQTLLLRMKEITSTAVPPIAALRPDLPKPLAELCDQLVALDRNQRPPSAAEVAELIAPWCAGAELPRLFTDGPLPEKPVAFPKKNRRPLWLAAAVIVSAWAVIFASGKKPAPSLPQEPVARLVFSPDYAIKRRLQPDALPRLFSDAWEWDAEATDLAFKKCGRLTPDGRIAYIDNIRADLKLPGVIQIATSGTAIDAVPEANSRNVCHLGIAPSGHYVWAMPEENTGLHIGRALPDGTNLPKLRYDFGGEIPRLIYETVRKRMVEKGEKVADGIPWGFAFATTANIPANTGLKDGDVLVADEGHRTLVAGVLESRPGIWRFRLDDDAPVRRLAILDPKDARLYDVTISRQGVFVLNAINNHEIAADDPLQLHRRILRWDKSGWHDCILDQSIPNAGGLAADPLSSDLYVAEGPASSSLESNHQRIVRLIPPAQTATASKSSPTALTS